MIQKNGVLTREDNRISPVSATRTGTQEDYPTIAETAIPVNPTEQTWILEVSEKSRVSRTTPKLVNALLKIMNWLNHLGSGKTDVSRLESRHNIHDNFRPKGIGLQ
jgi:hypothetical protein